MGLEFLLLDVSTDVFLVVVVVFVVVVDVVVTVVVFPLSHEVESVDG